MHLKPNAQPISYRHRSTAPLNILCAVFAICCLCTGDAIAVTTYSDATTFITAVPLHTMESFEDFTATNAETVSTFTAAGFVASHSSPTDSLAILSIYDAVSDIYPTDGSQYLIWRPGVSGNSLVFQFSSPITAFAFTATDAVDVDGELVLTTDSGISETVASGFLPNGNKLFYGMTADQPFSEVTISDTVGIDAIGFDELRYGQVPEPTSLALLGLGGLALMRRRRTV